MASIDFMFLPSLSLSQCSGHNDNVNTQYKVLCTISNNNEVYEESLPETKKISRPVIKFKAGQKDKNVNEIFNSWFFPSGKVPTYC